MRELSLLEARVLGVLVEKAHTVPDSYPLSPRIRTLKAVLAKLDPATMQRASEPLPPPKAWTNSMIGKKKRWR